MTTIRVVDYGLLEESDEEAPASPSRPDYHRWAALHSALTDVLSRFGTVGSGEGVDFYHSGDWFDERVDAFGLTPSADLSVPCLQELHEAVVRHDPAATVILEADTDSPLWGLEIYVRAKSIDIGWYESDAGTCRSLLLKHGLDLKAK